MRFELKDTNGINFKTKGKYVNEDINVITDNTNITPENIKKNVSILGVTGTLESGITPSGNIDITTTEVTNVSQYATAQVVDSNLKAENIAKGVSILGIEGTHEGGGEELPPYDINHYYPLKFAGYNGNDQELSKLLKAGGTKGLYTDMVDMFKGCRKLTTIPLIDTSNVQNMGNMFYDCKQLTTIPLLDLSKVGNTGQMFMFCENLTELPLLNTSKVDSMSGMFRRTFKLKTIPLFDTKNVHNMQSMFEEAGLEIMPTLDFTNVNNVQYMLKNCRQLRIVGELDLKNVGRYTQLFDGCGNIEQLNVININNDLNISWSTKMTREALLVVLNNLLPQTQTRTLTLGTTLLNKLTEDDKKIATDKGWTLK